MYGSHSALETPAQQLRVSTNHARTACLVHSLSHPHQAGDTDIAERLLNELVVKGVPLEASSFNPLLSAHGRAGRPEAAGALLGRA